MDKCLSQLIAHALPESRVAGGQKVFPLADAGAIGAAVEHGSMPARLADDQHSGGVVARV